MNIQKSSPPITASTVLRSFGWRFAERVLSRAVLFVMFLLLARLVEPTAHGIIAMVMAFTTILQGFADCGFGTALIQKKDADELDFSSVFFFNLFSCILLYILLFFAASYIAVFYGMPEMTLIVRVLGLSIVLHGINNVQQAYVSRMMQFRRFFFATLGGALVSAIVGVFLAYIGCGVWALVTQQITNLSVNTIILWFTVGWRPKWIFALTRLQRLWSFGWKILASGLLDRVYGNMYHIVIGKLYTASDLAFYDKGNMLPLQLISNINSSIDSVLFPAMANVQEEISKVRSMMCRAIQVSTYLIAPLMMGGVFAAELVIRLLLTEKWLPCVPYLQIFCICYIFHPIHTANLNAMKALGRSDLFLKLEIWKKILGVITLLCTMYYGTITMAYGMLFLSVAAQIINSWPNRTLLRYGYIDQLRDIMPGILLAVLMGALIWPISLLGLSDWKTLAIQCLLGAVIYITGSAILRLEAATYLWGTLRPVLASRFSVKKK